jgi:predicted Zn-dependent protease
MRKLVALALAAALAVPPAAAQQPPALPELGDSSQAALTPQMEKRIGEMAMREIRRDPQFVSDPEVNGYLTALGQRLVGASSDIRQPFLFFALRDPTINAFAIPGGVIGIHTGLILAAQSESELASVVAHEISHVTQRHMARQVAAQQQVQPLALLALALGILAARSNPQAAEAAIIGGQAGIAQTFLNYSRDFEREADRVGFQVLQGAGFDPQGMPAFFERLQRANRLYENNAPAYLRTHPLTSERIADMQGRAYNTPYKQLPDSLDFLLVRAKLRAETGTPEQAVANIGGMLREGRYSDAASMRYAYARALARAKNWKTAAAEMARLREQSLEHPMIENLDGEIRRGAGDLEGARKVYAAAFKEYPGNLALAYGYVETLQKLGRHQEAIDVLEDLIAANRADPGLWDLEAKSYGALGRRVAQHRALAEVYYLRGSIPAAIEQLQLARSAGDADFYTLSNVDSRLRELRLEQDEEAKERKR